MIYTLGTIFSNFRNWGLLIVTVFSMMIVAIISSPNSNYLFQLIFCLIFENKNWFRTLERKKSNDFPAKDAVYRFLNQSTFSWRRFLTFLSADTIRKVTKLTNHDRPKVLVLDDSSYDRIRNNAVELLAR